MNQNLHLSMNGLPAAKKKKNSAANLQDKQAFYLAWQNSGLNKTQFCRQQGIPLSAFYRWMHEIGQIKSSTSEPALVPVTLTATEPVCMNEASMPISTENAVDVWLPNGIRLRVSTLTALSPFIAFIQELSHANTVN